MTLPARAAPAALLSPSQFQDDLIALIPHLRAFSRGLCGRRGVAEDMAQEALAKAWRARARFEPGTNLKAWVFTILRNEFYSQGRRAWREQIWDADKAERIPAPSGQQDWTMELSDTARAMSTLPKEQREALLLVCAGGVAYEAAARICGTPVGTIKSRVARGRAALLDILDNGKNLPPRPDIRADSMSDDILAQLSALTRAGASSAAYA